MTTIQPQQAQTRAADHNQGQLISIRGIERGMAGLPSSQQTRIG